MISFGSSRVLFVAAMASMGISKERQPKLLEVFLDVDPSEPKVEDSVAHEVKIDVEPGLFSGVRLAPATRHISLEDKLLREASAFGKRQSTHAMPFSDRRHLKTDPLSLGITARDFDRKFYREMTEELVRIRSSEDILNFFKKVIERTFPAIRLTGEDSRYISLALLESISNIKGAMHRAKQYSKMIKNPLVQEIVSRTLAMGPCR